MHLNLDQVSGQQKVANALLDLVLVAAVATDELTLHHFRLEKDLVQVLCEGLVGFNVLNCWGCGLQFGKAQLGVCGVQLALIFF